MPKASAENIQAAVDENFEAFLKFLPELKQKHPGKFALMRECKIVEIFDTAADAMKYAEVQYEDGLYSIQQITDQTIDLGYFSHALHVETARSGDRTHH